MIFNIKEPYWGAWKKYGWNKGEWSVGLDKDQVDKMDERETARVETRGERYLVKIADVKKSPIEEVRWGKKLYIVRENLLDKL